ncbi:sce7726 family protein [Priestia megaterium]|uniref:sce7726 family protein n=1 Tax=Priestia megaterium TaxID=1404 RepID=UPI001C232949|nr:sce7726 family protein [Priestia megaterium]MBU8589185.1 sce7726 family protein [Priestia megaterium]
MLKDFEVRKSLIQYLHTKYKEDKETKIVNEMGICFGQSRIDVATINGILHGYEIKSESDTLVRLPSQMKDYNKVFERMTIVVSQKYLDKVRLMIPSWWGIIVVRNKGGEAILKEIRKGRKNKNVNPYAVSQLLWKEEALQILENKGLQRGFLSKPKRVILEHLSRSLQIEELQENVNLQLKQREGWKDHVQLM